MKVHNIKLQKSLIKAREERLKEKRARAEARRSARRSADMAAANATSNYAADRNVVDPARIPSTAAMSSLQSNKCTRGSRSILVQPQPEPEPVSDRRNLNLRASVHHGSRSQPQPQPRTTIFGVEIPSQFPSTTGMPSLQPQPQPQPVSGSLRLPGHAGGSRASVHHESQPRVTIFGVEIPSQFPSTASMPSLQR